MFVCGKLPCHQSSGGGCSNLGFMLNPSSKSVHLSNRKVNFGAITNPICVWFPFEVRCFPLFHSREREKSSEARTNLLSVRGAVVRRVRREGPWGNNRVAHDIRRESHPKPSSRSALALAAGEMRLRPQLQLHSAICGLYMMVGK